MKHVFSIIIGIFLGVIISSILIYKDQFHVSYTEITYAEDKSPVFEFLPDDEKTLKAFTDAEQEWANFEENFKADSSWKTIYGDLNKLTNLYYFVVGKIEYQPSSKALEIIAQNYGLDIKSAEAAVNGSISALMKSKKINTTRNYDQAIVALAQIKQDYDEYKEMFDIKSMVDLDAGIHEIFTNGDIQDSGFDLVKDLTDIEKILFKDTTKTFVGGNWDLSLPSPYVAGPGDIKADIIPNESGLQNASPSSPSSPSQLEQTKAALTLSEDKKSATFRIGDQEVAADVLEEDVCPTPDPLKQAAQNFDKENGPKPRTGPGQTGGAGAGSGPGAFPDGTGTGTGTGGSGDPDQGAGQKPEEIVSIQPAPGEDYSEPFCPNSGSIAGNSVPESLIGVFGGAAAGGTSYGSGFPGLTLKVSICITIELIWKTVSSYYPSDSCILCEIEKMNETFTKFLAHGLSPGKTTGNLFESPTCKKSLISIDTIDMKFMAIGNPIPLPKTDDVMFGGNAGSEWNKYIQKQSGWWQEDVRKTAAEQVIEHSTAYVQPNTNYDAFLTNLQMEVAANTASVSRSIDQSDMGDEAAQIGLVSNSILKEFQQIRDFFKRYAEVFQNDVYEKSCNEASKKDFCS